LEKIEAESLLMYCRTVMAMTIVFFGGVIYIPVYRVLNYIPRSIRLDSD